MYGPQRDQSEHVSTELLHADEQQMTCATIGTLPGHAHDLQRPGRWKIL